MHRQNPYDCYPSASSSIPAPRLQHPPSRLSPPIPQNSTSIPARHQEHQVAADKKNNEGPKRGYRACVHCRLRKAKCDLGDPNNPTEPPCSRCRREQRSCVFLPSKRRRRNSATEEGDEYEQLETWVQPDPSHARQVQAQDLALQPESRLKVEAPQQFPQNWGPDLTLPNVPSRPDQNPTYSLPIPAQLPQTASSSTSFPSHTQQLGVDETTPASHSSGSALSAFSPNNSSKLSLGGHSGGRERRHKDTTADTTRRIITSSFANETDALEILANAATDENDNDADEGSVYRKGERLSEKEDKHVSWSFREMVEEEVEKKLGDFLLVREGIVDEADVWGLVQDFFRCHHPALPVVQTALIPTSLSALTRLSHQEPFLLTVLICVASRHHPNPMYTNKQIHERTWSIIRTILADYTFSGLPASVGFVEGVLILAEFLPREETRKVGWSKELLMPAATGAGEIGGEGLQGTENRRSWSLTGLAIRAAYGLGRIYNANTFSHRVVSSFLIYQASSFPHPMLDQLSLEVPTSRTPELERAKCVWTFCYLYDRTIGLRTGLAFWSRGPSLCYTGFSHISQTGEEAAKVNFPFMCGTREDGNVDTDSADLTQALIELTQIMTNSHDILYPSKGRTSALVQQGTYFKYCDHFSKALQSYALVWTDKQWRNPSLRELAACTYHFVRLYVSSFAFQAHVQRAQMRGEEEALAKGEDGAGKATVQLFPRGSATSPDALYIYESIDAANEILNICLRLGQMGSLRYMPSRYLTNFVYGGVFALKAAYSGATSRKDMIKTRELVDHVCAALVLACPDRDHPASRYGGMLRMLAKKLEQLSDASAVPSRFPSPAPTDPHHHSNGSSFPDPFAHTTISDLPFSFPNSTPLNDQAMTVGQTMGTGMGSSGDNALFDFDVEGVNFTLDGFWDDFSLLGEGSGFPFK